MLFQKGRTWRTINVRILNKEKWRLCPNPMLTGSPLYMCTSVKGTGGYKLSKNVKKNTPTKLNRQLNRVNYIAGSSIYPNIIYGYLPVESAPDCMLSIDYKRHHINDHILHRRRDLYMFKQVVTCGMTTGPCGLRKYCVYICRKYTTREDIMSYKITRLEEPDNTTWKKIITKYRNADLIDMGRMSIASIGMDSSHILYVLTTSAEKTTVRTFQVVEIRNMFMAFRKQKEFPLKFSPLLLDVAKDGTNLLIVKDDGVFILASWKLSQNVPLPEKYLKQALHTVHKIHVSWLCIKGKFAIINKKTFNLNFGVLD